ncbi:MAG TPA: ornithine cyclodeaminase family protein [Acidimicrobiia bacterium]
MLYLDADATRAALSMSAAIEAMVPAFSDDRETPLRNLLGVSLFMSGRVGTSTGVKVVSTVPGKPFGVLAVFDGEGACRGLIHGPTLTAIRTAAGAGLATRYLARPDSRTMAMLGAGAMAYDQVMAVKEVRPILDVLVWSRDPSNAEMLAERIGGTAVDDPADAVSEADVVSTATPSRDPLFAADAVRQGTHINAVGAFTPEMCEIPPEIVRAARVVVDDAEAALAEAGDLLQAGVDPSTTMADLLHGREKGRTTDDEITLFKSVGIASQDVAAGMTAIEAAEAKGLGVRLD